MSKGLSPYQIERLLLLREHGVSVAELALHFAVHERSIYRALRRVSHKARGTAKAAAPANPVEGRMTDAEKLEGAGSLQGTGDGARAPRRDRIA